VSIFQTTTKSTQLIIKIGKQMFPYIVLIRRTNSIGKRLLNSKIWCRTVKFDKACSSSHVQNIKTRNSTTFS